MQVITSIDRRSNLSQGEFINEYVNRSLPVVLTDAAKDWKAMKKLTPAFFKKNYAHITKDVKGVTYNMGDFIDLMLNSSDANPAPYPYSFDIKAVFPELMADFLPQIIYGKLDRLNQRLIPDSLLKATTVYEIFFGGKGASFPVIHYDALYMNTQATQVYGSKDFFMYGPEQTPYLYPYPDRPKVSQVNFLDPDYEKFPLYKNVRPIELTLHEGETLFFPSGWWHTTKIKEPNITFGRAHLNGNNWESFIKDNYKIWKTKERTGFAAPLILLYGKLAGSILNAREK